MSNKLPQSWKLLAVTVYLIICTFDFWLMPVYRTHLNQEFIINAAEEVDPENRAYILEVIDRVALDKWQPVTTANIGGIIFHVTFGILMTGSALTRRTWTLSSSGGLTSEPDKDEKEKNDKD